MQFFRILNSRPFVKNLRSLSGTSSFVNVSHNDKNGIATVTMQRQPVNSLNLDLITQLKATLSDLEKNKSRGMILTSVSNSVFSAGLDIMEMYKPNMERIRDFWANLQDLWISLYGSSFATVAVINGHSPAGGCLLATSCEYRVMLPKFTIGFNETQLGIVPPSWFVSTMNNTVGFRQTELAMILGRLFSTEEALKIGLIDEIAANKDEGLSKAQAFLEKHAKILPRARALSKNIVRGDSIELLKKNREQDLQDFLTVVTQPNVQKSLELYLQSLKQKKQKQ